MAKKKVNSVREVEPYFPKPDTKIYVYIQKSYVKLNPVPYKFKSNYQYIIDILNDKERIH